VIDVLVCPEDLDRLRGLTGFVPVNRYARRIPAPHEVGALENARVFIEQPDDPDACILDRQEEIYEWMLIKKSIGQEDVSILQAECAVLGHAKRVRWAATSGVRSLITYIRMQDKCLYCGAKFNV
jgi:hypothetical protein